MKEIRAIQLMVMLLTLGSCASYVPKPLPSQVGDDVWLKLRVSTSQMALPALQKVNADGSQPWSMAMVAALAVLHNPDLEAADQAERTEQAEAFAAGLLPDPQIQLGHEQAMGLSTHGYLYGLSLNTGDWLQHATVHRAITAHLKQLRLERYWQEWQIAAASEQAYVQQVYSTQRLQSLTQFLGRLAVLEDSALQEEQQGLIRDDQLQSMHALKNSYEQLRQSAQLQLEQAQIRLHKLLGLAPDVPVQLAGLPELQTDAIQDAQNNLDQLSRIRPDLRALQEGYRSQEQRLRQAVLAQFPSIGIVVSRSRDVYEPVNAVGLELQFSLPVLSGQKGTLVIQKATREQLYQEYQKRVLEARFEVRAIVRRIQILDLQLQQQQSELQSRTNHRSELEAAMQQDEVLIDSVLHAQQEEENQMLERMQTLRDRAVQTIALQLLTGNGVFAPASKVAVGDVFVTRK